ncbi:MAG: amidohydrolase family protein [Anaerolineales bacterium]|nr:amidohydrolase family protein [Anaerolineales bacterium]
MNKFIARGICLLLVIGAGCQPAPTPEPGASFSAIPVAADALVVTNGAVIDGTGAPPIPDGIVVIAENKIVAVGHAADFAIPPEARVLDARGGTILPGIINSHVHESTSPLVRQFYFLKRGVTTVCDLATPLTSIPRASTRTEYGLVARVFFSGPIINAPLGYPGTEEFLYPVDNPAEARRAVTDLVQRGASMIKIALEPWNWKLPWATATRETIPNLDLDEVKAIVEQAHAHGKLVRTHLGTVEMLDLALDAGVDTIEHVPLPRLEEIEFQIDAPNRDFAKLAPAYEAQLARIVQQKIVIVPTLDKIITWCEGYAVTEARKRLCRQYALTPVRRFYQMGGALALGDDSGFEARTGMPVAEMRRLLAIGMTPLQVIQASTQTAARVCGHGDELGTLEPGKLADVIVIKGNPLNDIEAMNWISIVIVDGQIAVQSK